MMTNPNPFMTDERWTTAMASQLRLTLFEMRNGWHYCWEWDGMLVGPGMMEYSCCMCHGTQMWDLPPCKPMVEVPW